MQVEFSLAAILFLAAQTGAFLWWGGRLSQSVQDHARRLDRLEDDTHEKVCKS